jgi:nickel-dependent lactate racemase
MQIAKKYDMNKTTIKLRIKQHGLKLPKRQSNKLTEKQVKEIKKKISQGISNKELSEEYKVVSNTISGIRTGITWKNT